jgi:hypothetical protein
LRSCAEAIARQNGRSTIETVRSIAQFWRSAAIAPASAAACAGVGALL